MKIGDLFIKLGLQKGEFDKGIDDAKRQTSAFGSAMGKIGGMIAGVFAVGAIVNFGRELINLSGQAEGVQKAFNKIATAGDLQNLRTATKGTVSDLELMKRAVSANNFDIPVQQLGKLFEFAAKRAQDTGQSVDYLVDSIVVGIGRKSPLILDNLGISAIQLKSKLHGVGLETASVSDITKAVGDIAEESFAKTGRFADTLGSRVQTLGASFENLKLTISSIFSNSQMLKDDLDDWSKLIKIWQSDQVTGWEKFLASVSGVQANKVFEQMKMNEWLNQTQEESSGGPLGTPAPKQDPIVLTAVEQLAAIKKVNDELEAQRILRQEFKGQKMQPISGKQTPDKLPVGFMDTNQLQLGDMGDSWKANIAKNKKFTEEYLQDTNGFTDELNQIISSGIMSAIESMATGLTELALGDIGGKEFGLEVLQMVGNFMITLGTAIVTYSELFKKFIENISNPWVTAGLGIGLIAAGAAISSIASHGLKGSSGSASNSSAASGYSNYSQSSGAAALSGNVVFELEGTKLRGALNNTDRRNTLIR